MELKIDPELQKHIWPLKSEELEQLEKNILEHGIRDKIIVWGNTIIDGHNRYKIAKKHGIDFETDQIEFNNIEQAKDWMDANQVGRRNLTIDQFQISIGRRYNREKKAPYRPGKGDQNDHLSLGKTSERLAKEKNISAPTVRRYAKKAEEFDRIEKEQPELYKSVWSGEKSFKYLQVEQQRKQREEQAKKRNDGLKETPMPERKYDIILADPPWRYEHSKTDSRKIENQYPTMSIDELCRMDIPANENCLLYMWTTAPKLEESLRVMCSWDFKYRSCAIWDKEKIGMGYWFRGQHEIILVGVRGKFPAPEPNKRYSSVIKSPRSEHSKKPDKIYEIIESAYPDYSKIELFCRNPRSGWDAWGNEI